MYDRRRLKDRVFMCIMVGISILAIMPVAHVVTTILINGASTLMEAGIGFLTRSPPTPLSSEIGGIAPSMAGSLLMAAISLPITVVLGLFTAVLTAEFPRSKISLITDTVARSLASMPTIGVSMIVYTLVVIPMRRPSALAGALSLVIVALPYAYTYFSTALRSIPASYREAAFSIGMTRRKVVLKVSVLLVKRSIVTGLLITMARIMGETAALLFTAGRYRASVQVSIFQPVDAIPLLIFDYILAPFEIWHKVAWGAAFLLLLVYMILFLTVKLVVKEVRL